MFYNKHLLINHGSIIVISMCSMRIVLLLDLFYMRIGCQTEPFCLFA